MCDATQWQWDAVSAPPVQATPAESSQSHSESNTTSGNHRHCMLVSALLTTWYWQVGWLSPSSSVLENHQQLLMAGRQLQKHNSMAHSKLVHSSNSRNKLIVTAMLAGSVAASAVAGLEHGATSVMDTAGRAQLIYHAEAGMQTPIEAPLHPQSSRPFVIVRSQH